MENYLIKNGLLWGLLLWFIGWLLGIVFFAIVPKDLIGWYIMPIGTLITIWVLVKKIHGKRLQEYVTIGLIWSAIAIMCDYLFLVLLFNTGLSYYRPDVIVYYVLTFLLPMTYWFYQDKKKQRA